MSAQSTTADGRGNMPRNVTVSWMAHVIQIIAGFIVPRWIDREHGQELLGVWDLGWSLVAYFTLLEAGVSSSVNRYVALYRSKQDQAGVNRFVSSVSLIQLAAGALIVLLSLSLGWFIPGQLKNVPPELLSDARWLVILLGLGMAVSISGAVYGGILTGCHRWTTHHLVSAMVNVLALVGMLTVVKLGYGLIALALAHVGSELFGRLVRLLIAYRVCDGLKVRPSLARLDVMRKVVRFGGKLFLNRVSQVVLNQTVSVLIASHLGPAALALFSRPRSLLRQASSFTQKYAFMLVPTAATLQSRRDTAGLQAFVKESGRIGLYVCLPILAMLACAGGPILEVWMGKDYADPWLMAALVLAFLPEVAYQPLRSILIGLNYHGRPAIATAVSAGLAVLLSYLTLRLGYGGLLGVAVSIAIPWATLHALFIPFYAASRLGIPKWEFHRDIWLRPLACAAPFILTLFAGQALFPHHALAALAASLGGGAVVLAVTYWFWVIPTRWKERLFALARRFRFTAQAPREPVLTPSPSPVPRESMAKRSEAG